MISHGGVQYLKQLVILNNCWILGGLQKILTITYLIPFMTRAGLGHRSYVESYQNLPVDESEILIMTRPSHTIGASSAVGTGWDTKCRNKVRNALQTNL